MNQQNDDFEQRKRYFIGKCNERKRKQDTEGFYENRISQLFTGI